MLIVLDNAADGDQVEPPLPGGDSCTVVVTSRETMNRLISQHGTHHVSADVLGDDEARALLCQRLGAVDIGYYWLDNLHEAQSD